jgi:hypothetical protein
VAFVFYLDRYHLGDPLFLNRFGRDLAALDGGKLVVHGAAEDGERLLEAEGGVAVWRDGVLVVGSEGEHAIVERAARDLNRRVTFALIEAGIPAVRLDGASRGLLRADDDGSVRVTEVDWLEGLVDQGTVPVIAALMPTESGPMLQVNGGAVAAAIALALGGSSSVFFSRGAPPPGAEIRIGDVREGAMAEPATVMAAVRSGARVLLCEPRGVRAAGAEAVRLLE